MENTKLQKWKKRLFRFKMKKEISTAYGTKNKETDN